MTHYNRLSEISYNEEIKSWRFRVKIYRIYPFYSYVTGSGPHWTYILADEDRTKMEMTICGGYEDRFRGLEKQEGKWVEIFRVDVHRAHAIHPINTFTTKTRIVVNQSSIINTKC
ncbi:hypothetical protein F2Q68_00006630 [Brassica cretica]|uniref:Replication protein A 70 kDa DNA-binding subunit B/D first OB fold domain-containing protein n=1 Tax=Brassica cretica TaxID=69181 RepID=A0A8S9JER1_BRACR|nr:hypothetical protein F2Q68_00006630 [Brassica cretica]